MEKQSTEIMQFDDRFFKFLYLQEISHSKTLFHFFFLEKLNLKNDNQ